MRRVPVLILTGSVLVLLVVACGVSVAVHGGGPFGIDQTVMSHVVAHRSSTWTSIVQVVTFFFSPGAVTLWTAIVALGLTIRDRSAYRALPLVAAVVVAGAVGELTKILVNRPRPPIAAQIGAPESTFSYPSGHVTGTAAFVVAVVVVVAATWPRAARSLAWAMATVVVLVAAATRLYLGVHWVSDVAAGMCLGTAVVLTVPAATAAATPTVLDRIPRLRAYLTPPTAEPRLPDLATSHHR
ncbi:phosphatase PAP2 family protein [Gordonia sp. HY442]|uniref:phosphatase PAP2 family protein n=1 Tax=Gordonia zhenghanii TaxID=2911516 RepID=UPI001F3E3F6C|nr:phosphatase PAP2 family protein [Gordonia zhenghanii]MCF8607125.1 phosphatase PAP2 family protein [Gordonia zhenghanii]